MPKEIDLRCPKLSKPDSGGRNVSYTEDGNGYVSFTRFGEMVNEIDDQGGLIAQFPENGMTFFYDNDGHLNHAVLDVADYLDAYLSGLTDEEMDNLPNGGESIIGLIDFLNDNELAILVRMSPLLHSFKASLFDFEANEEPLREDTGVDYSKGLKGLMGIGGHEVFFEFTDYGDNLFMGIGETNGERIRIAGVEFSNFVNFEDEMFGDNPKRFHSLASKIILE